MEKIKYLIIGNGIAGLSAAKEIRKKDKVGSITMITNEPYLTYYRIKLTKYLAEDFKEQDLLVNKEQWYEENDVEVFLSKIVEKLDTDNNKILLDDGVELKYEKLLLATGSRSFIPPIEGNFKKGVLALRTIEDLNYVKDYIHNLNSVTIVGGGLLGLEAAWSLKKLGKKINIIELADSLLPKQLGEEMGDKLEKLLVKEGFNICTASTIEKIVGEDKTEAIRLSDDREIKTDAILFSVGIVPNLDIVRGTPLKLNRGILVDNHLKTNIDNIYAAGDVIEIDGNITGLWSSSYAEGINAGLNMLGKTTDHISPELFTTLELGDIKIFSVGDIEDTDSVYEYKNEEESIHNKLFVRDKKLIGGILFGDIKDMGALKKAVGENTDIEIYLQDSLPYKLK